MSTAPEPHRPSTSELPEGGRLLPITRWGTPVMHAATRKVVDFDDELATLVADMVATMYAAEGVGLAASQVGVDLALFVFDCPDNDHKRRTGVVCNPVLSLPEGRERTLEEAEEGCLSLPGAFMTLARPDVAIVDGVDQHGEPLHIEGDGLLARCLQHETDHCDGTVFGDRLPERARKKLYQAAEESGPDFPEGWPAHPVAAGTGC